MWEKLSILYNSEVFTGTFGRNNLLFVLSDSNIILEKKNWPTIFLKFIEVVGSCLCTALKIPTITVQLGWCLDFCVIPHFYFILFYSCSLVLNLLMWFNLLCHCLMWFGPSMKTVSPCSHRLRWNHFISVFPCFFDRRAQYSVLVPALWKTEVQDWELKCMNSLVLDESHHGPKAGTAHTSAHTHVHAFVVEQKPRGTQNISAGQFIKLSYSDYFFFFFLQSCQAHYSRLHTFSSA